LDFSWGEPNDFAHLLEYEGARKIRSPLGSL
jgi:hypothetical protein